MYLYAAENPHLFRVFGRLGMFAPKYLIIVNSQVGLQQFAAKT